MKPAKHLKLLLQAVTVWAAFWVAGLPDYFHQYSALVLGAGSTLLSVAISLGALYILIRARTETRLSRSIWISFYYTVPFIILDSVYCGVYLGHGTAYLYKYWYLTVFYFTVPLTFIPTALLLRPRPSAQNQD